LYKALEKEEIEIKSKSIKNFILKPHQAQPAFTHNMILVFNNFRKVMARKPFDFTTLALKPDKKECSLNVDNMDNNLININVLYHKPASVSQLYPPKT